MIRRTVKYITMGLAIGFAAHGNAGSATVTPALAACSQALIESLAKSDTLPQYSVKAPSKFVSSHVDPNSFTLLAHSASTKELLGKASCKATPDGEIISFKTIPVKS